MRTLNYTALSSGSMAGDIVSSTITLTSIAIAAVQCAWTGSPVGTLKLQASNDNVTYSDIANSSVSINGAGDALYNLPEIGFLYLRASYSRVSGTGSLTVIANAKGV